MDEARGIGDRFHEGTKYRRGRQPAEDGLPTRRPRPYKRIEDARSIALVKPDRRGGRPIWDTVNKRRSERDFAPRKSITSEELSQMLWASAGITERSGHGRLRAAPSAGGVYPLETYVAAHAIEGLEPGLYHYAVRGHGITEVVRGSLRATLGRTFQQALARHAAAVWIWSAIFDRTKWEYGQRALRYVYLDAGHAAQNLCLAAEALGLWSCPLGHFVDDELNDLLRADGEREGVVYAAAVGRPRP